VFQRLWQGWRPLADLLSSAILQRWGLLMATETARVTSVHAIHLPVTSAIIAMYHISYSGKYLWGPNFVLFVLSLSEWKFNTQNVGYDGRVFLCKMDRTKIKHTNQLEIAQNEIWTPWKFPAIQYTAHQQWQWVVQRVQWSFARGSIMGYRQQQKW